MILNKRKIVYILIGVVAVVGIFGLGIWIGAEKVAYRVQQPGTIDFSLFWDAYNKLQENYINPSDITDKKIIYGAIKGMTDSLGDPYTNFFDPEQAQRFQQDLSGSFDGIGVEIGIKKEMLTVVAPLKDTPGSKAGLKAGDIIAKIDGKDSINITTEEAVGLIRGQKGTEVVLTIIRDSWDKPEDIKIIRDTIKVPTIDWSMKGDTAYIQIYQFGQTLPSEFEAIAYEILQHNAKNIVLDLRNNPGGYLDVAQRIAGWFLQKGQTITIEDYGKGKLQQVYKAEGNSVLANYPIVVLINQGSASASEILAGALRDNRKVKLIGTKSFGKGCVQEVINLRGGSFLKVTIANWLTPNGGSITDVGLSPDVEVKMPDQSSDQNQDAQLDKALEIVKNLQ